MAARSGGPAATGGRPDRPRPPSLADRVVFLYRLVPGALRPPCLCIVCVPGLALFCDLSICLLGCFYLTSRVADRGFRPANYLHIARPPGVAPSAASSMAALLGASRVCGPGVEILGVTSCARRAGFAASSFGVHCAQMAGLRADVLQRAIDVIEAHSEVRVFLCPFDWRMLH